MRLQRHELSGGVRLTADERILVREGTPREAIDEAIDSERSGLARRRRRRRGGRIQGDAFVPMPDELDAIAAGLSDPQHSEVVTSFSVEPQRSAAVGEQPRAARRSLPNTFGIEGVTSTETSLVALDLDLKGEEQAALLLESEGVYEWLLPTRIESVAAPETTTRSRRKRAAAGAGALQIRTAFFDIPVTQQTSIAADTSRRRGVWRQIKKGLRGLVVKFVGKAILKGVARHLERDKQPGLVRVTGSDTSQWTATTDTRLKSPSNRPARILLLLHGTFSSTAGSFVGLAGNGSAACFLEHAFDNYDHIIGWDHLTLTETPEENAQDLLDWMIGQHWATPPEVDVIAFSRGGLVFRALTETLLPALPTQLVRFSRVALVGCTNSGTELANRENWKQFADLQINLVATSLRLLGYVPGIGSAARLLSQAVRAIGGLVEGLATLVLTDAAVPGLAAMQPRGAVVTALNQASLDPTALNGVEFYAITSNFDPDTATGAGVTRLPAPGAWLQMADKLTDTVYRTANDLVVDVRSMTAIHPSFTQLPRNRLNYDANDQIHHGAYFLVSNTHDALKVWLD